MRQLPLLVLLLAAAARAQVVPITGRVSAPVSGANAGAFAAPGAGLALAPDAGALLPPALGTALLQAPAAVEREAAAVRGVAAAAAKAVPAKDAAPAAQTPAALSPSGVLEIEAAPRPTDPTALSRTLAAAAKDAGDGKTEPGKDGATGTPETGGKTDLDGRSLFDGAAKRPDDANEPTEAELDAALGSSRRPVKTFLKKFGVAGALLAANSVAYAAVPNDGTGTGTLARLSFDTKGFLSAVHHPSLTGLAESLGRALSSMFMHANAEHIAGNMLMLLLFAPLVQSALGARRAMTIYFAGGLIAAAAYAFFGPDGLMLGASAAISALIGAALTIWTKPENGETVNIARICLQMFAALILFNEMKSLILEGPVTSGNVVTLAHVAGAAAGLLLGGWYAFRRATSAARSSSRSGPERPEGS